MRYHIGCLPKIR